MSNKPYWLILEGQNFSASILDTQDLSTIRGGSIGLKNLVEDAHIWLSNQTGTTGSGPRLKTVELATLGGSIGVWRVDADETSAAKLPAALETHLRSGMGGTYPGQHLGFGIGLIVDDGRPYSVQRERLKAAMQRQRLSASRTPFPALPDSSPRVCEFDFVRPADKDATFGNKTYHVSKAVWDRRELGKSSKQELIRKESGILAGNNLLSAKTQALVETNDYAFAIQINSISERKEWKPKLKSNLQDKICVITADGNSFGEVQKARLKASDTIEAQGKFDHELRALRTKIVCAALNKVVADGGFGLPSDEEKDVRKDLIAKGTTARLKDIIRFEVLLWGGDEIMFIVPARVGFDVLQAIAEAASKEEHLLRKMPGAVENERKVPVTFSVGAVFCHHDAPIVRVKALADALGNHIKGLKEDASGKGINGKDDNLFLTAVLESFDHIGVDTTSYLDNRVPHSTVTVKVDNKDVTVQLADAERAAFAVLNAAQIKQLQTAAQDLASGKGGNVSRGRLRQTANTLHHRWAPGAKYAGGNWSQFVAKTAEALAPDVKKICDAFGQDRFFALLEDYWDYLTPEEQDQDAQLGQQVLNGSGSVAK